MSYALSLLKPGAAQAYSPAMTPVMTRALFLSVTLHITLCIMMTAGLPFVKKDMPDMTPSISVDILSIDEITQTDRLPAPAAPEEKKPAPMPAVDTQAPPDLESLQETDVPPATEATDAVPPPPEEVLPVPEEEPAPKPEKPKAKPKSPEKPAPSQKKDFASLLKNLTPDSPSEREVQAREDSGVSPAPQAVLSDRLTVSELDSFKQQIEPCWNVPAGAKFSEDLVVEIRVFMNPDARVRHASILDTGRYNRDSHFRAAADSALRALRNPRCSPLRLPQDKYEQWKTIVIRFDPRDIL